MKEKIKKRLTKNQIFTIPNIITLFRLFLIPVIILLYLKYENYFASAVVIALSALTDVVDGIIARRFNLISDLGKFLDPVADKLTQFSMVFCIALKTPYVFSLLALLIIKDILLFLWGLFVLKKTDTVNSSKWYGKLCTVIIYLSMFTLFVIPDAPMELIAVSFIICSLSVFLSTILYGIFYSKILKSK